MRRKWGELAVGLKVLIVAILAAGLLICTFTVLTLFAAYDILQQSTDNVYTWVRSLAWSPDGSILLAGAADTCITAWDSSTGEQLWVDRRHHGIVRDLSFSPDGSMLVSGDDLRGDVIVWDPESGMVLHSVEGDEQSLGYANWSPDQSLLAASMDQTQITLWSVGEWDQHEVVRINQVGLVTAVEWSPDGTRLATSASDGTVVITDSASGERIQRLSDQFGWVNDVSWSPDSNRIASVADDGSVVVWSATNGDQVWKQTGHTAFTYGVAWSPSGEHLASASLDDQVVIWEAETGQILRTLHEVDHGFLTVEWSPDGSVLAAGADRGRIKVWDTSDWHEIHELTSACSR